MNVISTLFALFYQLSTRLYDGLRAPRTGSGKTGPGSVTCACAALVALVWRNWCDPSGSARYKFLRAETMQGFRAQGGSAPYGGLDRLGP